MKATSLKNKVNKLLQGRFSKSTKSKSSGVKNFYNVTSGYVIKQIDGVFFIYWDFGNILYRGKSKEDMNEKTNELYSFLEEQGLDQYLEWSEISMNRKAIIIKGD